MPQPPATIPVIVIAGPTASGKSALALAIAKRFGGTVINADSMQVYDGLGIITAAPSPDDLAQAPHRLYQIMDPAQACSAALWCQMARHEIDTARQQGSLPVVVGGTGLYLKTLTQGISPIPPIDDGVRMAARGLLQDLGNQGFHALLAAHDPVMAARLDAGNSQRLVRAWEVLQATGQSLAHWQALPRQGAIDGPVKTIALLPDRIPLNQACARRFSLMVQNGAIDEVRSLMDRRLDPALPAMKALGVPELAAFIRGDIDLKTANQRACASTCAYAKRQMTWFRHQLESPHRVYAQFSESLCDEIFSLIHGFLLTR